MGEAEPRHRHPDGSTERLEPEDAQRADDLRGRRRCCASSHDAARLALRGADGPVPAARSVVRGP